MGSVGSHRSELYHHINMKFLVAFSAIVAMAYAEADPYYGYGYAGAYGLGYHGLGYGYAHGLKSAPCVNAANVPVPCAAGGYLHYGKRDAEADPYYGYGSAQPTDSDTTDSDTDTLTGSRALPV